MAGSDKRQRGKIIAARCLDEEFNAIAAKADKAGLAVAAFMRAAALGDAGPRAQRRPPIDHVALRQILGQSGRIGNNINQIARALNIGEPAPVPALEAFLRACADGPVTVSPELDKSIRAYLDARTAMAPAIRSSLQVYPDIRNAIFEAIGKNPGPGM
jgi:hypothetical protein